MGLGHLFAIGAGGQQILQNFGLIDAAVDAVFSIWSNEFLISSLRVRSEYGDTPVYGFIDRPESSLKRSDGKPHLYWTRIESHVPIDPKTSLRKAAIDTHNSTQFLHIATLYRHGAVTHTLHYRRAHPDDLGMANDGTYHQVRAVLPDTNMTSTGIVQRAEASSGGVVMDYLWKSGQESLWHDTFSTVGENTLDQAAASTVTSYLQSTGSEVSCADVIVSKRAQAEQGVTGAEDIGILAFGWNNKPFGFNGRSAGWLSTVPTRSARF